MLGQGQYVFEGMCEMSGRNEAGRSALTPDPAEAERLAALSRFALLRLATEQGQRSSLQNPVTVSTQSESRVALACEFLAARLDGRDGPEGAAAWELEGS